MPSLPDDVLARILHLACIPGAWPWSHYGAVCREFHALCRRRRTRYWFLAHSSLPS